jgi:hypothetical protein
MRAGPRGRLRKLASLTALTTASILVAIALLGVPTASAQDNIGDAFFLEFDYGWVFDTSGYTLESNEPGTPADPRGTCPADDMHKTIWFVVTGTGRRITLSTRLTETNYDTVLAVYKREGSTLQLVDCNDDFSFPGDLRSEVEFQSEAVIDYFVQVGSFQSEPPAPQDRLGILAETDPPGNDNRANAADINASSQVSDNYGATLENEENHVCGGLSLTKSVWFKFTAPERGRMVFEVGTGFFDAVTALYAGDSNSPMACGRNLDVVRWLTDTGDVGPGTYYLQVGARDDGVDAQVDEFLPDEGLFSYQVNFTPDADDDDDGVPDSLDRCPLVRGTGGVRDCPDPDNDGWADGIDDRCSGLSGRNANLHRGCPDNDGDDVPEGPGGADACPTLNARQPAARVVRRDEKPRDGCPDTLLMQNVVEIKKSVKGTARGIRLRFFRITGVPPGSRVIGTCTAPGGRRCGKPLRVKRATTGEVRAQAARDFSFKAVVRRPLRFGTRIVVRVTAPYATGKYYRLTVTRTDKRVAEFEGCTNPGSKKPRKRGCR